jgi:hypothetical protein
MGSPPFDPTSGAPPEGGGDSFAVRVYGGEAPSRAEPLPKAEAKLLLWELFIKLRLMKRGLGAKPHVTASLLLSGFTGAKLPKGAPSHKVVAWGPRGPPVVFSFF